MDILSQYRSQIGLFAPFASRKSSEGRHHLQQKPETKNTRSSKCCKRKKSLKNTKLTQVCIARDRSYKPSGHILLHRLESPFSGYKLLYLLMYVSILLLAARYGNSSINISSTEKWSDKHDMSFTTCIYGRCEYDVGYIYSCSLCTWNEKGNVTFLPETDFKDCESSHKVNASLSKNISYFKAEWSGANHLDNLIHNETIQQYGTNSCSQVRLRSDYKSNHIRYNANQPQVDSYGRSKGYHSRLSYCDFRLEKYFTKVQTNLCLWNNENSKVNTVPIGSFEKKTTGMICKLFDGTEVISKRSKNFSNRTSDYLLGNSGMHCYNGNPPKEIKDDPEELEVKMIVELSDHLSPDLKRLWAKFKYMMKIYLDPTSLARCEDLFDICNELNVQGHISIGNYEVLQKICDNINHTLASKIIQKYTEQIKEANRLSTVEEMDTGENPNKSESFEKKRPLQENQQGDSMPWKKKKLQDDEASPSKDVEGRHITHKRNGDSLVAVCSELKVSGIRAAEVKRWEEDEKTFVSLDPAGVIAKIEEMTSICNILTIVGPAGSGKSCNMHHVALKWKRGDSDKNIKPYEIYPVYKFEEIEKSYEKDINQVFAFDDVFGNHQLQIDKLASLEKSADDIKGLFKDNSKKLFMTMRTDIFLRLPTNLITHCNVIYLSDRMMNSEQRVNFLLAMMKKKMQLQLQKLGKRLSNLVENCDVDFFPFLCDVYCQFKTMQQNIFEEHANLKRNFESIFEEHANLKRNFESIFERNVETFCCLALCLVYTDEIIPFECSKYSPTDIQKKHDILKKQIEDFTEMKIERLEHEMAKLDGVYIVYIDGVYTFRHIIIKDIVTCILAERKKRFLIDHCSVELCLTTFALALPVVNIKSCFDRDIGCMKTLSRKDLHCIDRTHDMSKKSLNLELRDQVFQDLATKCVEQLLRETSDEAFLKLAGLLFNSVYLQNKCFFVAFLDKFVKQQPDDNDQKNFILLLLFVSACLCHEHEFIKKHFPDFSIFKNKGLLPKEYAKILEITPLLACVYSGNADEMKTLINDYTNNVDELVMPLCLSVFKADFETAKLLIEHGADVNVGNPSPLEIVLNQDFSKAELKGESKDESKADGKEKSKDESKAKLILKLLLDSNAEINTNTNWKKIVQSGNVGALEIILEKSKSYANKDMFEKDRKKFTLLSLACRESEGNENIMQIIQLLLKCGADINKCDGYGNSPLTNAAKSRNMKIIEYLLKQKAADINIRGQEERSSTPLCTACNKGSLHIVEKLLEHHARVNTYDGYGNSPLTNAAKSGNMKIIECLLKQNADVNKRGQEEKSSTPLCTACHIDSLHIVEKLLEHDASVNQCDGYGNSPLTNAVKSGNINIVNCLLLKKANVNLCGTKDESSTPLCTACFMGSYDIVKTLLEFNANVNKCDGAERSPLARSIECERGNDVFDLLLGKDVNVNICGNNALSLTPLVTACRMGSVAKVERLLELDADINQCDGKGNSPLTNAIDAEKSDVIKVLLEMNADVNVIGDVESASTPLCNACFNGDIELVRKLIKRGADISKCDNDGKSPLKVSKDKGYHKIVKLLIENSSE